MHSRNLVWYLWCSYGSHAYLCEYLTDFVSFSLAKPEVLITKCLRRQLCGSRWTAPGKCDLCCTRERVSVFPTGSNPKGILSLELPGPPGRHGE